MNGTKRASTCAYGGLAWGLALLAWAAFIASLALRGSLGYYLHPRMAPYTVGAVAGFSILGFVAVVRALKGRGAARPRLGLALFLAPLVASIGAGPRGLSEEGTGMRVMKTARSGQAGFDSVEDYLSSLGPGETIRFAEWSHAALIGLLGAEPERFQGRRASLVGFAYRPATTPPERLYAIRLLVTCCVADAEPLGLLVEGPGLAAFSDFEWLELEGVLGVETVPDPYTGKEGRVPVLRVERAVPAPKPSAEYLFPGQL